MIKTAVERVDRVLTFFEEWTLFIMVTVALVSLFLNVVLRYGFNYSLAWSEELVRDVVICTTFIGCSAALKSRSMICIDAPVQIFPALRRPLGYVSCMATAIFSVMMVVYGCKLALLQVTTGQKSIIMQIPLVYLYSILPLTGVMMFLRTLQMVYEDVAGIRKL